MIRKMQLPEGRDIIYIDLGPKSDKESEEIMRRILDKFKKLEEHKVD